MSTRIDTKLSRSDRVRIDIGPGLLATLDVASDPILIADRRVWELHGHRIGFPHRLMTVEPGESSKSWLEVGRLVDGILNVGVKRATPVVLMGGGVVGDLGGFVASIVLRGLPLIHIPTTLLAMVDSSIGGKTGVNHPTGKNLIGTFHQADRIVMDLDVLDTLPMREWRCGLGEVLKYGMIHDPSLLDLDYAGAVDWADVVRRCVAFKVRTVEQDEREAGIRAYLNYGHTFAHALENVAGYGTFAHGEAVFVGMVAAARLGEMLGADVGPDILLPHARLFPLSTAAYLGRIDELIRAMRSDKKIIGDSIRFIVVQTCGSPFIREVDSIDAITEAWRYALETVHTT